MAKEIERKYLVEGDAWRALPLSGVKEIAQAYLKPDTHVLINFSGDAATFAFHGRDGAVECKAPLTGDFAAIQNFPNYDAATGRLSADPKMVFRIRTAREQGSEKGFVTIKRPTGDAAVNDEYELAIPYESARRIQSLACEYFVAKKRHMVDFQGTTWEVDVFAGPLHGLVIAEVEAPDLAAFKSLPMLPGVTRDVTEMDGISNYALGRYGMPRALGKKPEAGGPSSLVPQ